MSLFFQTETDTDTETDTQTQTQTQTDRQTDRQTHTHHWRHNSKRRKKKGIEKHWPTWTEDRRASPWAGNNLRIADTSASGVGDVSSLLSPGGILTASSAACSNTDGASGEDGEEPGSEALSSDPVTDKLLSEPLCDPAPASLVDFFSSPFSDFFSSPSNDFFSSPSNDFFSPSFSDFWSSSLGGFFSCCVTKTTPKTQNQTWKLEHVPKGEHSTGYIFHSLIKLEWFTTYFNIIGFDRFRMQRAKLKKLVEHWTVCSRPNNA